ncbi:hypothetical protein J2X31_002238 [Flavobacterium arsenatis]|uniref:Carboxypeptidase regulatory-like domain-containing protein n=1 Tax=Flavobacterium arsenatis TaxID=1484332 RepID=A0ABU1TQH3_9FLAO|nr:hypothetical protein [Flavobacterium arsenatis]MDR6968221.1 hypothetical protein [Flavobacterium arsenatis]
MPTILNKINFKMKRIICLLIVLLSLSCEIQYEGKRRFIAETTVVDQDGNPLEGIKIEVDAGDDNISNQNTDKNGYSIQIFPSRSRRGTFSVSINPDRNIYQNKVISNIEESDFEDYKLNLGSIMLFKNEDITSFRINLNQVSENVILESLEINAISIEEFVNYNEDDEEEGYYYPETYYNILKNQTFTIFYSLRHYGTHPSTLTEYSVNVSIGNDPLIYELEF